MNRSSHSNRLHFSKPYIEELLKTPFFIFYYYTCMSLRTIFQTLDAELVNETSDLLLWKYNIPIKTCSTKILHFHVPLRVSFFCRSHG